MFTQRKKWQERTKFFLDRFVRLFISIYLSVERILSKNVHLSNWYSNSYKFKFKVQIFFKKGWKIEKLHNILNSKRRLRASKMCKSSGFSLNFVKKNPKKQTNCDRKSQLSGTRTEILNPCEVLKYQQSQFIHILILKHSLKKSWFF